MFCSKKLKGVIYAFPHLSESLVLALCEDFQSKLHQTLHDNDPQLNVSCLLLLVFISKVIWLIPSFAHHPKTSSKGFLKRGSFCVDEGRGFRKCCLKREVVPHHGSCYYSIHHCVFLIRSRIHCAFATVPVVLVTSSSVAPQYL